MNEVLLGMGQFYTFSSFSGWAEMLSTDRTYPRNSMLHLKKWHIFDLIFNLKSFSLWNTISIGPAVHEQKMHILSRSNSKVTNCWSPEHISIRWQKHDPEFDKPKGHPCELIQS